MAAYVTGDLHGRIDIPKLLPSRFPLGNDLTKDDYLIIAGDFGLVFGFTADEMQWLDWLESRPWTTLFVDGNHENHEVLAAMPAEPWHGGLVHRVRPSVLHLMRGQVFDVCGSSVFTMGGATSVDRAARVARQTWWPGEMPSDEELVRAAVMLDAHDWRIDYVVTHCCATSLLPLVYGGGEVWQGADRLTDWFDAIEHRLVFRRWYFGHHHRDMLVDRDHRLLYDDIVELGGIDGVA